MAGRRTQEPRWLRAARVRGAAGAGDWVVRALGRGGALPRVQAEAAISAGRLTVDGGVVTDPFAPLPPGADVRLDGRPLTLAPATRALVLHKPAGLVVDGTDPEGRGTVFGHLEARLPPALAGYAWLAAGRLDRDTTGLLVFTNAPELVARLTRPEAKLEKRYVARVAGRPGPAALAQLAGGLVLDDGPTAPARAALRAPDVVELTLTEGRHHQVKRMLAAVGHPVLALHREAVGPLTLDGVAEGAWRELGAAEVAALEGRG